MSRSAFSLPRLLAVVLAITCLTPLNTLAQDQAQQTDPVKLWEDFSHYVLIARPDLAADMGQQLIDAADAEALLTAVEASDYTPERVLPRARLVEHSSLPGVAASLENAIQAARIDRSRDPLRIAKDIELLAQGDRAYVNAVARLKAAGQYAAPQLLGTLLNPDQKQLHPFVITAMVAVGQDLVYPLTVALPDLEPVPMTQVAQVLEQIGYPTPLPTLQMILEADGVDPGARQAVAAAFDALSASDPTADQQSAAQLFTSLAGQHYRAGTRGDAVTGYDAATGQGLVWAYLVDPEPALVPILVPGAIYADARVLRDTKAALALNPALDPALSLYIAANLRRENRLPEGAADPSYQEPQPASFYAMLAGPARLQDVLTLALDAGDTGLALDAIDALGRTAGTEALTTTGTSLVRGLTYPDRRVRFHSAQALAGVRPASSYDGSFNVVKILADEVRQGDKQYALVLADDQDTVNLLLAALSEQGYEAFGSTKIGNLTSDINSRPGVDLVVIYQSREAVDAFVADSARDFKLNATPILALVTPGDQILLNNRYSDEPRVSTAVRTTETEPLKAAVDAARSRLAGAPINAQEASAFSLTALSLLRDIAISGGAVYNVLDAQPALEQALTDDRPDVVVNAGFVLAMINNASAQQAILDAALTSADDVQLALLDAVAVSAQNTGNLCTPGQTGKLLALVQTATGDAAVAAAAAHGSLMLSTPNAVSLINHP